MLGTAPLGSVPLGGFSSKRSLSLVADAGVFTATFSPRFFGRLYAPLIADRGIFTHAGQDADVYLVGIVRPNVDLLANGWRNNADGTELFSSIDEADPDDLDFIQSRTLGVGEEDICEMALQDLPNPAVDYGHRIEIRYRKRNVAGTITANVTVELRQGTTVIDTRTFSDVGTGWTSIQYEIPSLSAANITNYDDLRLRLRAHA
jgi:hypothetical protein